MSEQHETAGAAPEQQSELQSSLDDVSNAVAQFSTVEAGLAELRGKYEKVIFLVDTAEGLKDARGARLALRMPRYEVERIRKEAKAPILELGRRLDARAKQITDSLLALEGPIDDAIKAEETRAERERQAKAEAEVKRVETIQQRISEIRAAAAQAVTLGTTPPAQIMEAINRAEGIVVDASFAEFRQQAADAKLAVLATLRSLHTAAVEREAELARIKAEREELARLRAEQEKRDAAERARRDAEERKARAAREEEERKQREALDEQRRQQAAEQERIDAENRRIAEERAEFEREQEAARKKREADERKRRADQEAERKKREAAERDRLALEKAEHARKERAAAAARKAKFPGEAAIITALCAHFEVPEAVAQTWLAALKAGGTEVAA